MNTPLIIYLTHDGHSNSKLSRKIKCRNERKMDTLFTYREYGKDTLECIQQLKNLPYLKYMDNKH